MVSTRVSLAAASQKRKQVCPEGVHKRHLERMEEAEGIHQEVSIFRKETNKQTNKTPILQILDALCLTIQLQKGFKILFGM